MSNFWREIQNGLSDCKYWGISEKILRKEYFSVWTLGWMDKQTDGRTDFYVTIVI